MPANPLAGITVGGMPELSRFFGIVIRLFAEAGGPHHQAHFHAYYQDDVAVFGVDPIEIVAGRLPLRQIRLVEAWAELHQQELRSDWERLLDGNPPIPIDPLT
jgi:Domain of unknown function (DUF4160)